MGGQSAPRICVTGHGQACVTAGTNQVEVNPYLVKMHWSLRQSLTSDIADSCRKWYWNVVPEHKLTLTETIFLEEFRRGLHYRIATESISHRFFNNCSTTGYNKKGQCARTKPHLSNMSVLLGDTPSQNWHQHMHGTQQITFEQHVPCFLASHRQMSKILSPSLSFPLFPSPVLESVSSRTNLLFSTLPVCAWSFSVTPTI